MNASLSKETHKSYNRILVQFNHFCGEKFPKCNIFPAHINHIAAYIVCLFERGLCGSTIATHVSAISFVHKINSWVDPTSSFLIKKLIHGSRKLSVQTDTRLPITLPILTKLINSLKFTSSCVYHKVLLSAMYSLCFFALLRVGEVTSPTHNVHANLLLFQNVEIFTSHVNVTFFNYKHSKPQKPVTITIHKQTVFPCPVQLLLQYVKYRGSNPGPLFQFSSGAAISRHFFYFSVTS